MAGDDNGVFKKKFECHWVPIDSTKIATPQVFPASEEDKLASFYIPITLIAFFSSAIFLGISYLVWTYFLKRRARRGSLLPMLAGARVNLASRPMDGTQFINYDNSQLSARLRRIFEVNERRNELVVEAPPPSYDELFAKTSSTTS